MRLDFVFVLVAFGTVIACASCASQVLTSSDVQRESDDDHKSLQKDLLSKMAAPSQDSENTITNSQSKFLKLAKNVFSKLGSKFGQSLKKGASKIGQGGSKFGQQIVKGGGKKLGEALKGTKDFFIDHRKGISKGLGRFTGEVIGTLLDRNTGEYYPGGGAPVDYPGRYPNQYPYGAPRNPDTGGAPVNYPGQYPHQYPYGAPRYLDTDPRYSNKAPGTDKTSGDPSRSTAPRNPETPTGTPKDSPSHGHPGGHRDETYSPIKPQGEKVLAKLLEEQAAPLQQDSLIRKQNKYRYSRRGTLYKIKRFFKDIYQGLSSLYLSN